MTNARGKTVHGKPPVVVGAVCLACLALLTSTRSPSVGAPHPRGTGLRRPLASSILAARPTRRLLSRRADNNTIGARQGTSPSASPLLRTVHLGAFPQSFLVDDPARSVVVLQSTGDAPGDPGAHLVLTVLDARTGAPLRTASLRIPYDPAPKDVLDNMVVEVAVDPRNGRLLAATADRPGAPGHLDIRDPRTLAVVATRRFRLATAGGGGGAMLADARLGRLFIRDVRAVGTSTADVLDVADLQTGALLRTVPLPGGNEDGGFALDARTGRLFVGGHVLDARSLAVVATIPPGNAGYYAVDEAAGRVVSSQTTTALPYMTRVSIIDARSGAVLHTRDDVCTSGGIALDTVAGRIACLSIGRLGETEYDAGVDVLDTRSGRLLHQYEIGHLAAATFALDVDARHGRAIVVLVSGYGPGYADGITVVDLRSGRGSDSSVTLGQGRPDIVVDQATGRTFVANEGDKTVSVLDTARLP